MVYFSKVIVIEVIRNRLIRELGNYMTVEQTPLSVIFSKVFGKGTPLHCGVLQR
jgi:hypothetical protein